MRPALRQILSADPIDQWARGSIHAWDFLNGTARWNYQRIGRATSTPGWSFTRASTGYATDLGGALVSFASGQLRRIDGRGILIEGSRTNLCLQSQTFDNASWSKARSSVSADTAVAPDRTTTADSFIEDSTATNTHELRCTSITKAASAIQYAGSFYAKANTRSWLRVMIADSGGGTNRAQAWFDLTNGVVGTKNTAGAGFTADDLSISALGNGWYRCTLVATTDSSTAVFLNCALATGDVNTTYSGDGASGVYLWGAQLEPGAFPSSYVPTVAASATRAADVLTVPVSGIANPLSFYAEIERVTDTGTIEGIIATYLDGSNFSGLSVNSSDKASCDTTGGGSKASAASIALATVAKIAGRCAANDVNVALNGTAASADATATMPSAPTTLQFGKEIGSANYQFGYLRRAAIWPRALSDAELQSLTQ